jgi:hypothetical protein
MFVVSTNIRRLRELEDENRRLKQMSAELLLENRGAERCDRKKAVTPAVKRELVAGLQQEHGLTERRACAAVSLGRSVYRYRRRPNRDDELIKLLLELAHRRPEEGFPKLFQTAAAAGPVLESQASASGVLQPEIEQTAERKATIADT